MVLVVYVVGREVASAREIGDLQHGILTQVTGRKGFIDP